MTFGSMRRLIRGFAFLMVGWSAALLMPPWGKSLADDPPEHAGSWTAYIGTHYDDRPWAGTIREPGGPRLHRYGLPAGDGGEQGEAKSISRQAAAVATALRQHDAIVLVGGLSKNPERMRDFVDVMRRDRGARWRAALYRRAANIMRVEGAGEHLHWQLGNEINNRRFSEAWRFALSADGPSSFFDHFIIEPYVEFFLAPAVATLRAVSKDVLGDPATASIVLGSAANAYNPNSRAWLDSLLDYRIRGDFAPSLAGQTVADVVDIVSIHYLVTAEPSGWDAELAGIFSRWVGSGRIRGVWATEELGRQRAAAGMGAITALRVVSRCLSWAARNRASSSQFRCIFWGASLGPPETHGDDGLQLLFDFFGKRPLSTIRLVERPSSTEGGEVYAFGAPDVGRYAIIMYPPPDAPARDANAVATPIRFRVSSSWPARQARGFLVSSDGIAAVDIASTRSDGGYLLELNAHTRLLPGEALVILADAT